MGRRYAILGLALAQGLLAAMAGVGLYAVAKVLAEVRSAPDTDETQGGLLFAVAVIAAWILASLVAAAGLWKRQQWARWLAVGLNAPLPLLMLYEWLGEGEKLDADEWPILLALAALAVVFALPVTGRALREQPPPS